MKVRDLMIKNVVTAKKNMTIEDAVKILYKKHVGALMITDDKGKCEGIFTERDALRSVAKKVPLNTSLKQVMSKNVVTISENSSFAEAKRSITSQNIRHLPVVDKKGYLVGILTLRRILDELVGMPTVKS